MLIAIRATERQGEGLVRSVQRKLTNKSVDTRNLNCGSELSKGLWHKIIDFKFFR
jgi:hypothetical protein